MLTLHTNGHGLWSNKATGVGIVEIELFWYNEGIPELRVYFDTDSWDVKQDGLIYTDPLFETELQEFLHDCGFEDVKSVNGSEQGMRGRDYVSLDTSDAFAESYDQSIVDQKMKWYGNE